MANIGTNPYRVNLGNPNPNGSTRFPKPTTNNSSRFSRTKIQMNATKNLDDNYEGEEFSVNHLWNHDNSDSTRDYE